ncbi:MAG: peptidoglycan bridge formation glycyltransferase FemA/FemB family protein [Mojavia pulchra JT2-VF2]|jgi:lipid II:glycine glycyltransferase (peptidoglycan interpeptide bridge formation enzyme)|uniref:Peptidoglycan bridge formation glycyltransferase FemA/FemB family protein n=1 Tax=Mojavia pulchra JT2-VF2 TaxID=287848 RepID=A0A951UH62_9NOST|nr:peptidoglycan bridge formation glycyltransferase FemA/FemB family protein [Mojavia pulchra JT2-VF2]
MTIIEKIETNLNKQALELIIRELTTAEQHDWDLLVKTVPHGCFMQTSSWAYFKEIEGYKTFRYGLFLNGELVGGCIYYLYPHPNKANLLIVPGGPILPDNFANQGMQLLLNQAGDLAQKIGAIALRIEPLWIEKPDYLKDFVRAPADLLPCETLLIDLRPDTGQILAAMKPKGRYNIRLSQRHGVKTEFSSDSQKIPVFYDLFWETVQRQQFFGEPYGFFINLCQTLFAANMAEIGLATWRGEILAAILLVYCGDIATYLYGGRSFDHPEVMANYSLHWEALQRAKSRGCQVYDFYGFTRNPNHAYAKFSQFKSQFGGTPITTIGAHDYFFYDQLADTLISLFRNIVGGSK